MLMFIGARYTLSSAGDMSGRAKWLRTCWPRAPRCGVHWLVLCWLAVAPSAVFSESCSSCCCSWRTLRIGPETCGAPPQVSTLLLVPICPHTCEHVWRALLRRPGSALTAGWPAAPEPDYGLRRAADYLDALVSTVRLG